MDTRTGEIHELAPGQTLENLAEQLEATDKLKRRADQLCNDLVRLQRKPNPECKICRGLGRIKKGLNSRRFKPCECTTKPFLP